MTPTLTNALAALASRLTASGDYEAVDVIDTASARIARLEEALVKSRLALNMHEAWEGNLIMSELELDGIPAPTQSIWDDIVTHLQPHRAAALGAIRASLGSDAE